MNVKVCYGVLRGKDSNARNAVSNATKSAKTSSMRTVYKVKEKDLNWFLFNFFIVLIFSFNQDVLKKVQNMALKIKQSL